MPRNVRNYWVDVQVDGRQTKLASGPEAKDGGIAIVVYMRDNGNVTTALRLDGTADQDGNLSLVVWDYSEGEEVYRVEGKR